RQDGNGGQPPPRETESLEELAEGRLVDWLARDPRPRIGAGERVAAERWVARTAVGVGRAPRLGVVVRSRVVLHQIEAMSLGEGDRRLRELRSALVLVRIEVAPHRERDAVHALAAERSGHALAG